jgi:archaellum component FlaC
VENIGGWDHRKIGDENEMFNRQLKKNIVMLDKQIGELSNELNGLMKDTKYDVKMRTLEDLTELRGKLAKGLKDGETSDALVELDKQIEELTMLIINLHSDVAYSEKLKKLEDLTKARCQLSDAKTKESNVPAIISGVVGLSAIVLVLKYEEANIITSKAFNMIPKMFRGI